MGPSQESPKPSSEPTVEGPTPPAGGEGIAPHGAPSTNHVALPSLTTLEQLRCKLRALHPSHIVGVETLESINYKWNEDDTLPLSIDGTSLEHAFHEPIGTLKMQFDGELQASRSQASRRPSPDRKTRTDLLPPPPVPREPRSPVPSLDSSAHPPRESLGSAILADFIAPGCERTRCAFNALTLSDTGISGMAVLEAFHAERLAKPAIFPPPISWNWWEPQSSEFASLQPFSPFEVITPILKGSDNIHRAIELHCIFTSVQSYLRATREPTSQASEQHAQRPKPTPEELSEIRRTTEDLMRPPPFEDRLRDYDPQDPGPQGPPHLLSKAQTLTLLYMGFERLVGGISQSLPVMEVVDSFFADELCNFSHSLTFQIKKSLCSLLDEYNSSIAPIVHTHHLDITELVLQGDTASKRHQELMNLVFTQLPNEPGALVLPMVSREVLKEVRPHVYNQEEQLLIIEAAKEALRIVLENDLESNGPRTGTRPFKHLLEVGTLLMLSGERPEVVVAGLFHDIYELYEAHRPAEDLAQLRHRVRDTFGHEVDDLIAAVTEPPKGVRDSKDFFLRKSAILAKLNSLELPLRAAVARILCASKISTLLDGLIYMHEKGTTRGWSSGTWAQNIALHTFLLEVFEANQVSTPLTANYRAQLVKLAGWARRMGSETDLAELKESLEGYFHTLNQYARAS
ncbi:MAG: hypothetical protein RL518_2653 [Pseudomonadota bacterium]